MKITWHCAPAARATSSPLTPGMRMSRNATCGRCCSSASSALRPSSHSATTFSSGHSSASSARSSCRCGSSSSAMIAVGRVMRWPAPAAARVARARRRRSRSASSSDAADAEARAAAARGCSRARCLRPCRASGPRRRLRPALRAACVRLVHDARAAAITCVTPGFGSTPCLIAFSTSEISSNGGNGTSLQLRRQARCPRAAARRGAPS